MSDEPQSFSDEVYDESRYTPEARKIIEEWAARNEPLINSRRLVMLRLSGDDPIVPVFNALVDVVEFLAERVRALEDFVTVDTSNE